MFSFDLMAVLIILIVLMLGVLVGVAFLTLLERKVLGYIQIRKGPNKVGYMGILQPFGDAVKLFTKEHSLPLLSNYLFYCISPMMNFFFALLLWFNMPFFCGLFSFNYSILFFLCCSSMSVYSLMLSGWSSNSSYSLLGSIRAIAQTISYEVSLIFIILCFLFMVGDYSMLEFSVNQEYAWFLFMSLPLCFMWLVSGLAETNRTPFDFAEGESELVSGFNVEYSGVGFALIFMAEYSSILYMSMFTVVLFIGGYNLSFMFFSKLIFVAFFWVWVRGTLPRFRYDKLMYLAWKSYLPVVLNFLIYYSGLSLLIFALLS